MALPISVLALGSMEILGNMIGT